MAEQLMKFMDEENKEEKQEKKLEQPKQMQGSKTPLIKFTDDPGKTNVFMILFTEVDDDGHPINQTWQEVTGRDEAFETIVSNIDDIDLLQSYIMIRKEETVNDQLEIGYRSRKSCYGFLRYVIDNELVANEMNIDPDDYIIDFDEESTTEEE